MEPASGTPVKVLTVGSAAGAIRELFLKLKAIDAKHGKFDFALCTGDFFGPQKEGNDDEDDEIRQLLAGNLEVPFQCYVMQGEHPLPDIVIDKFAETGGELCNNLFLLSKSGTITTALGLRVACLGGIYAPSTFPSENDSAPGFTSSYFSSKTVDRLLSNTLTNPPPKKDSYTSLSTIMSAVASSQLIDILITNVWSPSITQFSSVPLPFPELATSGAPPLNDIVQRTKPRYHFCSGGPTPAFWEREPFVWDDEGGRVSRFISLGSFGREPGHGKKQRWFYAFSIAPDIPTNSSIPRPANATRNPYLQAMTRPLKRPPESDVPENYIFGNVHQLGKRNRIASEQGRSRTHKCPRCQSTEHTISECPERVAPPEGYVCRICKTPGHLIRDCPTKHAIGDTGGRKPRDGYVCRACGSEGHYLDDCPIANQRHPGEDQPTGRRGRAKEIAPSECWFCLSNPNVTKYLIVAIGEECYVTLAKGQIIPTQSAADTVDVPGGGHVLIVPITHYPTLLSIPPDQSSPILEETEKYKNALRAMFAKYQSAAVFFEVGRLSTKGGHAHVQALPIPLKFKDAVESAFLTEGRKLGIEFEAKPEEALQTCVDGAQSYFTVDLPDGRKMVHLLKDRSPFSVQFGRQVLVNLLGIPDRLDWKACMLTLDEDKGDAQAFKTAFKPFNPFH